MSSGVEDDQIIAQQEAIDDEIKKNSKLIGDKTDISILQEVNIHKCETKKSRFSSQRNTSLGILSRSNLFGKSEKSLLKV